VLQPEGLQLANAFGSGEPPKTILLTSAISRLKNGCSKEEEVKVQDPQSSGIGLGAFGSLTLHL
jgi:hypothetical protein